MGFTIKIVNEELDKQVPKFWVQSGIFSTHLIQKSYKVYYDKGNRKYFNVDVPSPKITFGNKTAMRKKNSLQPGTKNKHFDLGWISFKNEAVNQVNTNNIKIKRFGWWFSLQISPQIWPVFSGSWPDFNYFNICPAIQEKLKTVSIRPILTIFKYNPIQKSVSHVEFFYRKKKS